MNELGQRIVEALSAPFNVVVDALRPITGHAAPALAALAMSLGAATLTFVLLKLVKRSEKILAILISAGWAWLALAMLLLSF